MCMPLPSSVLSQGKLIPLTTLPWTIEIELADQRDAFVGTADNQWGSSRPRLVADVCDLDQALANSYAKRLLDGKSLPMYMLVLHSIKSTVPAVNNQNSLPIARCFARLSTVYVTFWDVLEKWVRIFYHPSVASPGRRRRGVEPDRRI